MAKHPSVKIYPDEEVEINMEERLLSGKIVGEALPEISAVKTIRSKSKVKSSEALYNMSKE